MYGAFTSCGGTFQFLPLTALLATARSYNPVCTGMQAVWALPRSLATTGGIIVYFLFLDVSVPSVRLLYKRMTGLQPDGLSHSEIRGSRVICTSPQLVAAYHVLHRLREPRHPPYALNYFPYLLCTWHLPRARLIYTFSCTFC